ncbi:YidC/Oxa1 family membrane protein insertase [Chloroflexota bacterium]
MNAWELIIQQPVINILVMLTQYLGGSFGLAIITLTIGVNILILPLNLKQIRSTKAMQEIQPRVAELQKKYAKDKQKLSQEQMKLYKESGMNPAGCLLPMLIQMPVWIALYQSVMLSLAVAPEGLLNLSRYLYSWPELYSILPLSRDFMWGLLDLAEPNPVLAILVGATMWLQQKMATPVSSDPKQAAQSRMMLWMMPMMFTFLALSFPSGLALFWVTSSIVRIAMQYYVSGWGSLVPTSTGDSTGRDKKYQKLISRAEDKSSSDVGADIVVRDDDREQTAGDTGYQAPGSERYQPGRDRNRRRKK